MEKSLARERRPLRFAGAIGATLLLLGCSDAEPTAPTRAALTPESDWEYKLIINVDEGSNVLIYTDTQPVFETQELSTIITIHGETYCPLSTDLVQKKYRDA